MSAAAAAATFSAMDANHDGVVDKQEFAAAISVDEEAAEYVTGAPVVVLAPSVAASEAPVAVAEAAVMETRQPAVVTYVQPTYVCRAPQTYAACNPGPVYTPGEEHPLITLTSGMRVVYTSRSNSQKYHATVMQRVPTGYLLKLDVDGGIKEVEDVEIWRVECFKADSPEQSIQEETTAEPLKENKSKKSSGKGKPRCC
eukprot:TRINITY_DN1463_c1_g1_i1.p1 TRINITY_DN1463_c1_g1~~TRINITY_DN1463_c1_g1_i1.p1  ORF type:complete len:224 (+),score=53.90 TRINITY_DN1463_c1_g1_i1:77-673(+)